MKNLQKVIFICFCIVALLTTAVVGTLAWLADTETVSNTFTMGKVDITVDEAKVNTDGTAVAGADRVTENCYHLIPGQTYTKDPTMTVKGRSDAAYVRMLLTVNCKAELDAVFAPGTALTAIFNGYDASNWIFETEVVDTEANTVTYEFRYKDIVEPDGTDVALDALFDSFTIPGTLDGADLKSIENLKITVTGHAIQATGFATDDTAWAAFDAQVNP